MVDERAGADGDEAKERVRQFFTRHAEAYRLSPSHRAGWDLGRLVQLLEVRPGEEALDVATATGHTAFALAAQGARVTGLDLTPEMEPAFRRGAEEAGVEGVAFHVGDAERLPFPDASFHIVTCRRAAHHFPDAARAVGEMARVLKPGGRLGIVDMITPDHPEAGELMNRLERVRDSSHLRAFSEREWRGMVHDAGLVIRQAVVQVEEIPFDQWLYPVAPDSPEGRETRRIAEREQGEGLGAAHELLGRGEDGFLTFRKRRIVLVAVKP